MHRLTASVALASAVAVGLTSGLPASASAHLRLRPEIYLPAPSMVSGPTDPHDPSLATDVAEARAATAKYLDNLALAKADGYSIITRMIPDMGYHFLNPAVKAFDLRKPPILVYEHDGARWQLGALEWVFTAKPATSPLPGATYGSFPAACHYADGTFVPASSQSQCATTNATTGAKFTFWHPNLVTLHFWVWYPNSAGIYSGMNPLVAPFNAG